MTNTQTYPAHNLKRFGLFTDMCFHYLYCFRLRAEGNEAVLVGHHSRVSVAQLQDKTPD